MAKRTMKIDMHSILVGARPRRALFPSHLFNVARFWATRGVAPTILILLTVFLSSCKPTYRRDVIEKNIKDLAKKEYKLDVTVEEKGETIGIHFTVKNLMGELVATDQLIWTHMEDLMTVLHRTALSSDRPPKFLVLDIMDEDNPRVHLLFTRAVIDLQKAMAEALSRNQFLDRLIIEFVIGDKRTIFDPNDTDLVRFMMMAMDTDIDAPKVNTYHLEEVKWPDFLAKVAAKTAQRFLREDEKISDMFLLRDVTGNFISDLGKTGHFKILVDMAAKVATPTSYDTIDKKILPFVAKQVTEIFKSYKFDAFNGFTVVEKNSGKTLAVTK